MVWRLIFFLLLVLSYSNCYVYNVCKVLTAICREDSRCLNVELFSQLCDKKYQQYSTDPDYQLTWTILPAVHPEEGNYKPDTTSSYYTNDKHFSNNQDSNNQDYQVKKYNVEKRSHKTQFKSAEELLNVYNLYKRHSVEESLRVIQQKLNSDLINTNNDNNYFYNQNSDHYDAGSDPTRDLDIVKKVVALLKTVKKLNLNSESKRLAKATDKEVITSEDLVTAAKDNRKKKREESEASRYSPEDNEEVALPVYSSPSEEENLVKKETIKEDLSKENLVIQLSDSVDQEKATRLGEILQSSLPETTVSLQKIDKNQVLYRIISDRSTADSVAKKINKDPQFRRDIESKSGENIIKATTSAENTFKAVDKSIFKAHITVFAAVVSACTLALAIAAVVICLIKRKQSNTNFLGFKKHEAVEDYKELCRTQMSVANSRADEEEDETDKNNAMRHNWYEDQFPYNMDISTGHVILAYMEDHLKNENRLNKEWEALCNYKADDEEKHVGGDPKNATRNRYRDVLPFDRTRVKLREVYNAFHADYINANYITDVDPQNPDYIATQGPMDTTVADFWQMVWEQRVVVLVNLTKLSDMGLPQCHRYWPEDGSEIYHIYEVHLISEHIWCDDYLVRSLYLKNLQMGETRTITQFHYLTWPDLSIPESSRPLLEFRRKVNKCYRGQSCPIIVHCNNGVGRTGTYILLDMVLNKMIKGAKEIDIAATLEHLRDQRQDMVKTKGQFEFALTAMAEEVTAVLSAVPK